MANDTTLTVIGNLTADPDLRFTASGAPVANFTVASTPRTFNRQANDWIDGETLFIRCTAWRDTAENVAESLTRGARVLVSGRLVSRSWEDKDTGQKRSAMELQVDDIGPSLRNATAKVTKTPRGDGSGRQEFAQQRQQQSQGDPWQQSGQQGGGWGSPSSQGRDYDEPPF